MDPTTKTEATSSPKRKPLFEYPSLPRLEIAIYFLVVSALMVYIWLCVFIASRTYEWNTPGRRGYYADVKWPNGVVYRKDATDSEWWCWNIYIRKFLPWLAGHALLFNLSEPVLPKWLWGPLMLGYWLVAHATVANPMLIGATMAHGFVTYCVARFTRSVELSWLVGVALLYWSRKTGAFTTYDENGYGLFTMAIIFPYKTVQYLTFLTEMLRGRGKPNSRNEKRDCSSAQPSKWPLSFSFGLYEMFWYAFYLPFSCPMIVTYGRFPAQIASRAAAQRKWPEILAFGLRILFWYVLAQLVLYAFHFNSMMVSYEFLSLVPKDILFSVLLTTAQFFHLKYVVIFGVPAFFARIDKMQPFSGPICVTRVALYSKMTRFLTRYQFLA